MRPPRILRSLTDSEQQAIQELHRHDPRHRVRCRANAIRLGSLGYAVREIATVLGVGFQTVHSWFDAFEAQGVTGLFDKPKSGAPPKAGPDYRQHLRDALAVNPKDLGYPFTTWSVTRLRAHMAKQTGVLLGEDRVRQLIKAENYTFKRPKHTLKGKRDEAAFAEVQEALDDVKKKSWVPTPRST